MVFQFLLTEACRWSLQVRQVYAQGITGILNTSPMSYATHSMTKPASHDTPCSHTRTHTHVPTLIHTTERMLQHWDIDYKRDKRQKRGRGWGQGRSQYWILVNIQSNTGSPQDGGQKKPLLLLDHCYTGETTDEAVCIQVWSTGDSVPSVCNDSTPINHTTAQESSLTIPNSCGSLILIVSGYTKPICSQHRPAS